jgi:cobalamin biosynthesis Mg chelatase CobN
MSTDTNKDSGVVDAAEVEETVTARPAAKKKQVRRVRVIEVIDDGELDDIADVLTTLDAVDSAESEAAEDQPAKPVRSKSTPRATADEETEDEETEDEPAPKDDKAPKTLKARNKPEEATTLSARLRNAPMVPFSILVVLLAAVSSAALYFWK